MLRLSFITLALTAAFAAAAQTFPGVVACDCETVAITDVDRDVVLGDTLLLEIQGVDTAVYLAPGATALDVAFVEPGVGRIVVRATTIAGDVAKRVACDRDESCLNLRRRRVGERITYSGVDTGRLYLFVNGTRYDLGRYRPDRPKVRFDIPAEVPRPSAGLLETPTGVEPVTLRELE